MRVTWTPLNEPVVDHYTVHYSRVNGVNGRRRRLVVSGTVTFPASVSSGVVSGLQEGQQYQFSVSVSLLIGGQVFTSVPGPNELAGILYMMHDCSGYYSLLVYNYFVESFNVYDYFFILFGAQVQQTHQCLHQCCSLTFHHHVQRHHVRVTLLGWVWYQCY